MRLTLGEWETSVRFAEARYGEYEDQPGDVPLTLALSLRGRGNRRHGIELLRGVAALVGAVFVEDLTDFAGFRVITERLKYSSG